MFISISTKRNQHRNGLMNRFWVVLTCVMLLPLPVPTAHRHDSFDSSVQLAHHVASQHSDSEQAVSDLSELHWHFAMPSSQRHDDHSGDGFPADQIPAPPAEYTGGLSHSSLVFGSHLQSAADSCVWVCQRELPLARNVQDNQRRAWLVDSAQHRHCCALSCVMRC